MLLNIKMVLKNCSPFDVHVTISGQVIPCFVSCSKNGSIMSMFLTNMMKHIESWEHSTAPMCTPSSCSIDTEVILRRNSLISSIHQFTSGRSVLVYLMGHICDRFFFFKGAEWKFQEFKQTFKAAPVPRKLIIKWSATLRIPM